MTGKLRGLVSVWIMFGESHRSVAIYSVILVFFQFVQVENCFQHHFIAYSRFRSLKVCFFAAFDHFNELSCHALALDL